MSRFFDDNTSISAERPLTRINHLQEMKNQGHKWAMLTAYDYSIARIFDQAGIPVLLVGDSAANVVYGYPDTIAISPDELLPLVRGVVRGAPHALVVADLPFGSYEASPQEALQTARRFLKEGGAHAVKIEGGRQICDHIRVLRGAGIPVMAHIGFTPQHVHCLGGFRVQGRDQSAQHVLDDAVAVEQAGAFAVVLEMVPAKLAHEITHQLQIPTIGIGAGNSCDGQVLVWHDMVGLTSGKTPRFVRRFANVGDILYQAACEYAAAVSAGTFPDTQHCF